MSISEFIRHEIKINDLLNPTDFFRALYNSGFNYDLNTGSSQGLFGYCTIQTYKVFIKISKITENTRHGVSTQNEGKVLTILRDLIKQELTDGIIEIYDYVVFSNLELYCNEEYKQIYFANYEHHKNIGFINDLLNENTSIKDGGIIYATEYFDPENTLFNFIRQNITTPIFISILLQLIYTMYIIKTKHPNFMHGDLHLRNIIIVNEPDYLDENSINLVTVNEKKLSLPYYGYYPKIIDFNYAHLNVAPRTKINETDIYRFITLLKDDLSRDLQENPKFLLIVNHMNEIFTKTDEDLSICERAIEGEIKILLEYGNNDAITIHKDFT